MRGGLFLLGLIVAASGCSGLPAETKREITLQKSKPVTELTDTQFNPQEAYQCGPAALATVLDSADVNISPESLVNKIYIPGREGSLQIEIVAATRASDRLPYILDPQLDSVIAEIDSGRPVLILQNLGVKWLPRWHYAVVVGYDKQRQELILRSGITKRKRYSFKLFDRTWRRSGRWAMIVVKTTEIPVTANEDKFLRTILPFEQTQHWNIAAQAYTTAANKWPGSLGANMGSGNSYYSLKSYSKAILYYRKAVAIDPEHAPAHNNIANALLEIGKTKEAEEHARIAVNLGGPHLPAFKETLENIQLNRR